MRTLRFILLSSTQVLYVPLEIYIAHVTFYLKENTNPKDYLMASYSTKGILNLMLMHYSSRNTVFVLFSTLYLAKLFKKYFVWCCFKARQHD